MNDQIPKDREAQLKIKGRSIHAAVDNLIVGDGTIYDVFATIDEFLEARITLMKLDEQPSTEE